MDGLFKIICITTIFGKIISDQTQSIESNISGLIELRNQYPDNPLIGYLNINSLSGKIDSIRNLVAKTSIDIFCVDETKLDCSFPDHQFKIEGYQFPLFKRDRKKNGGGKIVFCRDHLIIKRLTNFETETVETICIDLNLNNKKWFIMFAYIGHQILIKVCF